jgi:uncharacterized membrane protein (DUF2068 family)
MDCSMTDAHRDSAPPPASLRARRAQQLIALFEALKGVLALAASIGLLSLLHHDLRAQAIALIGHFDLDPTDRYPSDLLRYAEILQDTNKRTLVLIALGYVTLRAIEAHGLWTDRAWGEWLGALSGILYIPFEVRHLMHRPTLFNGLVVAANIVIVAFLGIQLWRRGARLKR